MGILTLRRRCVALLVHYYLLMRRLFFWYKSIVGFQPTGLSKTLEKTIIILSISIAIILIISVLVMSIASLLSKKTISDREKNSPFECGFDPKGTARLPFPC